MTLHKGNFQKLTVRRKREGRKEAKKANDFLRVPAAFPNSSPVGGQNHLRLSLGLLGAGGCVGGQCWVTGEKLELLKASS